MRNRIASHLDEQTKQKTTLYAFYFHSDTYNSCKN